MSLNFSPQASKDNTVLKHDFSAQSNVVEKGEVFNKDYVSNFGFGTPQFSTNHSMAFIGQTNPQNKLRNIGRASKLMTVRSEVEDMKQSQSKVKPLGVKLL